MIGDFSGTVYVIEQVNSGMFMRRRLDGGGWLMVGNPHLADQWKDKDEAVAMLHDFECWLGDFGSRHEIYSGDYWSNAHSGANSVTTLTVTYREDRTESDRFTREINESLRS